MNENVNKEVLAQVMLYLLQDVEEKKKTLTALKSLLDTDVSDADAVSISVNSIYQRYVKDVNNYLEIFQGLGIDVQGQKTQEPKKEIEPTNDKEYLSDDTSHIKTKKEQEIEVKEEEFDTDLKSQEEKLEQDVDIYEQDKLKEKMKGNSESLLDRLNLLKK
jgi:hypothetical protein